MSRNKLHLFLGILILITPFTGLPTIYKTSIFCAIGGLLILISIIGHMHRRTHTITSTIDKDSIS
ncbi:MAG: hypothetical protein V4519_04580 [Patescibacteria group bacterium]